MAGSGVATGPNSISGMLNDPMLTLVLANVTLLNGVVDTIPSNTNELVSNAMLSVLTLPTDAVSIKVPEFLFTLKNTPASNIGVGNVTVTLLPPKKKSAPSLC